MADGKLLKKRDMIPIKTICQSAIMAFGYMRDGLITKPRDEMPPLVRSKSTAPPNQFAICFFILPTDLILPRQLFMDRYIMPAMMDLHASIPENTILSEWEDMQMPAGCTAHGDRFDGIAIRAVLQWLPVENKEAPEEWLNFQRFYDVAIDELRMAWGATALRFDVRGEPL